MEEQLYLSLLTEFSTTTLCHIGLESENLFLLNPLPIYSTLCLDPVVNTKERFTQLCTSHATGAAFHYHENTRYFSKAISGAFCIY